jgi:hypothetical protein
MIERKIIIENSHFYYSTIDEEFQIATLHVGSISDGLKKAKNLALPAGRNFNNPIVPFSWDLSKDDFYAINFLNHPLNDRNEALKRFKLGAIQEQNDKVSVLNKIMESIDLTPFAYNDPYLSTIKRSNTLINFFFDGIVINDTTFFMAITNNGEFSFWSFDGLGWKNSEIQKLSVDAFFTLFEYKKRAYMFLNNGQTYEVSTKTISQAPNKTPGARLSEGVLIINKDDNTVKYIKNNQLDFNEPLDELIKNKAIEIF